MIWLLVFFLVVLVCAVLLLVWTLTNLLTLDATARGLAHPGLLGTMAASTQNGIGVLAYLALRRNRPIDVALDQPQLRTHLKVQTIVFAAILLTSSVCALLVMLLGNL